MLSPETKVHTGAEKRMKHRCLRNILEILQNLSLQIVFTLLPNDRLTKPAGSNQSKGAKSSKLLLKMKYKCHSSVLLVYLPLLFSSLHF